MATMAAWVCELQLHQPHSLLHTLLHHHSNTRHMDSSLHEVWQAAAGSPFLPVVGKDRQFLVGFVLMLLGLLVTGVFALSASKSRPYELS